MELNEMLKRRVAERVWTALRERSLQFLSPNMKAWNELSPEQQQQLDWSIQVWLRGIGSNEVLQEWFNRSGHHPEFLWEELRREPSWTLWPGLDVLFQVIEIANEQQAEYDAQFQEGANRVIQMINMAVTSGMTPETIQAMVDTYQQQLAAWRASESPGEPPSGYALVGEFLARQHGYE